MGYQAATQTAPPACGSEVADVTKFMYLKSHNAFVKKKLLKGAKNPLGAARYLVRRTWRHIRKSIIRHLFIVPDDLNSKYKTWYLNDGTEHLSTETCRTAMPYQDDTTLQRIEKPFYEFNQPSVTEIPNATVIGDVPLALTPDGKFILDVIHHDSYHANRTKRFLFKTAKNFPIESIKAIFQGNRFNTTKKIDTACILASPMNINYFHWVTDQVLKLRAVEHYQDMTGEEVTIIIGSEESPFVFEFLDVLGYGDQYVELDKKSVRVEKLVVPSFPEPTPKNIDWLQNKIVNSFNTDYKNHPKILYLSRQNARNGRKVSNHSDLEEMLSNHDVEVIELGNITLEEEVRLLSNASAVISPHGAGLTAMMWGTNLVVVELFNDVINAPYYTIAHVMGHDYIPLVEDSIKDRKKRKSRENIKVDLSRTENIILDIKNRID